MSDHNHSHGPAALTGINNAFVIGISLNLAYVVVQIIVGLNINSLSLLSDAGHNFLDVAGLVLAMLAFRLSDSKATARYTYGYKKASVLISLLNAVILLISIGAIGYEALLRFRNTEPLPGKTIAIIALIGIVINGVTAFMFYSGKDKDINIKAAFLHLASDTLVSVGLLAGGIIIYYTQLYWIDPLLSIIICFIILLSTWRLLRDSIRLSLDGVPENIDVEKIKSVILQTDGVQHIHHLHIWAISTSQNAMTGHIVIKDDMKNDDLVRLKVRIKHELEHHNIHHTTLETEFENQPCASSDC